MLDNTTTDTRTHVLSCYAGPLVAAIAVAKLGIYGKGCIPVLDCLLFNGSSVIATDCDMQCGATVQDIRLAQADMPYLVHHADISKFLAGVDKSDKVDIVLIQHSDLIPRAKDYTGPAQYRRTVEITADGVTATFNSIPEDDFPRYFKAQENDAFTTVTLPQADLYSMLSAASTAVSSEETRYYLNGVFIHAYRENATAPGYLHMVTTDGHRMVELYTRIPYEGAAIIMPRATVAAVLKALDKKAVTPVTMTMCRNEGRQHCQFASAGWVIDTKIVDGTFPDYTRVRANRDAGAFTFDIDTAAKACRRIAGIMDAKAIGLDVGEGTITSSHEGKGVTAKLHCDLTGDGHSLVGVNVTYLQNILTCLKPFGDSARGHISSTGNPFSMEPAKHPAWGAVFITQMPMRL